MLNRRDVIEKFDNPSDLTNKVKELAKLIQSSQHLVVHAGAGISTSACIPDFRGPKGVWTLQEKGEESIGLEFEDALPTLSHMALVELQNMGILKYISSQNVDGLFLRSGIKEELLSELHGNVYLEKCKKCQKKYLREFDAALDSKNNHQTGRLCSVETCKGKLVDSIVHSGEDLPVEDLERATSHSKKVNLSIVVGSSLQVTPACKFPEMTKKQKGMLVIINLMDTPLDDLCDLRIYGKSDDVFQLLAKELDMKISEFEWKMNVWVGNTCKYMGKKKGNKDFYEWSLHVTGDCGFQSNFLQKAEVKRVPNLLEKKGFKKRKMEDNEKDSNWTLMEGEGEGMFEITQESVEELTVEIKLHFIPRIQMQPHHITYKLNFDSKGKKSQVDESMVGEQNYTIHLKDIQY